MALIRCVECGKEISSLAAACPNCGAPRTEQVHASAGRTPASAMGRVVKKSSFAGGGCALQALGLLCLIVAAATFLTVIGPVVFGLLGLWLLHYGGKKASWYECSNCGGRIANNRVAICPHCAIRFR